MSKRSSASSKEKLEKSSEPVLEEIYSSSVKKDHSGDEDSCCGGHNVPANKGKKQKSEGINWAAVGLLLMFCIPAVFGLFFTIMDYVDPDAAVTRKIRQPLEKCYHAANPEKVNEIDKIMLKYKGSEQKLFAQLRSKYEKYPECQIWPPH